MDFRKKIIIVISLFATVFNVSATNLSIKHHPRLFFPGKSFKELEKSVSEGKNQALSGLNKTMLEIARTEGLSDKEIPLSTAKKSLNTYARKMSTRIFSAAYAFRVTHNQAYLEHATKNIGTFIKTYGEYHKAVGLESSELWLSLSLAYDWLYKSLDKNTKDSILKALDEFGFDAVEGAYFYTAKHNFNHVCNAALVCAAIATYEEHPEKSEAIIRKSVESNHLGMKGVFYPDGVSGEGPSYWDYATNFEAIMLMALEDNFGTEFNLSKSEGFEKGGLFRVFAVSNTGDWFNYGDCNPDGAESCTALWYYAWKFGRKDLLFRDLERAKRPGYSKARALFMSIACAQRLGSFEAVAPKDMVFHGKGPADIVIARNGWKKEDAYLGIKGGQGEFNHSHLDEGSFVYEVDGFRWADELHHPDYKIYNKAKKDGTMTKSTKWERFIYNNRRHSTLTINDRTMCPAGVAPIVSVIDCNGRRGGSVDLTQMFGGDLSSALREIVILSDGSLEIKDVLETSEKKADVRWTLVTPASTVILEDRIVLSQGGKTMALRTSIPVEFKRWSSNPKDYDDSPFRLFEPDASKDAGLCGFEFSIPAMTKIELITTIARQ